MQNTILYFLFRLLFFQHILPIFHQKNPDLFVECLGTLGVDAYRGATQLNCIEPDDVECEIGPNLLSGEYISAKERYPYNAKYFRSHVVYLPVNKFVPFYIIDRMAQICCLVSKIFDEGKSKPELLSQCHSLFKAKL